MGRQTSTLDQALPVLLLSRSPSPFLCETELRGRCPKTKILPFASERSSFSQALPAPLRSQALPPCAPRKGFFVHSGPYAHVRQGGRQYLVVPLDTPSSTWREAVAQRVAALDSRVLPYVAKMVCTIDGNIFAIRPEDQRTWQRGTQMP